MNAFLYTELDQIQKETEIIEYQNRLIDRFGKLPPEAEELLNVVRLRLLGKRLGVERIAQARVAEAIPRLRQRQPLVTTK